MVEGISIYMLSNLQELLIRVLRPCVRVTINASERFKASQVKLPEFHLVGMRVQRMSN